MPQVAFMTVRREEKTTVYLLIALQLLKRLVIYERLLSASLLALREQAAEAVECQDSL